MEKPVVFGPVYKKYIEALELIAAGSGISISGSAGLKEQMNELLKKNTNYGKVCEAALNYVYSKQGATQKILQFIQENRLLTN